MTATYHQDDALRICANAFLSATQKFLRVLQYPIYIMPELYSRCYLVNECLWVAMNIIDHYRSYTSSRLCSSSSIYVCLFLSDHSSLSAIDIISNPIDRESTLSQTVLICVERGFCFCPFCCEFPPKQTRKTAIFLRAFNKPLQNGKQTRVH